jgi:transposase
MIQLSWLWLRHQPQSALTQWFKERVKRNGGRLRKTTIVALARKLLVALWIAQPDVWKFASRG